MKTMSALVLLLMTVVLYAKFQSRCVTRRTTLTLSGDKRVIMGMNSPDNPNNRMATGIHHSLSVRAGYNPFATYRLDVFDDKYCNNLTWNEPRLLEEASSHSVRSTSRSSQPTFVVPSPTLEFAWEKTMCLVITPVPKLKWIRIDAISKFLPVDVDVELAYTAGIEKPSSTMHEHLIVGISSFLGVIIGTLVWKHRFEILAKFHFGLVNTFVMAILGYSHRIYSSVTYVTSRYVFSAVAAKSRSAVCKIGDESEQRSDHGTFINSLPEAMITTDHPREILGFISSLITNAMLGSDFLSFRKTTLRCEPMRVEPIEQKALEDVPVSGQECTMGEDREGEEYSANDDDDYSDDSDEDSLGSCSADYGAYSYTSEDDYVQVD